MGRVLDLPDALIEKPPIDGLTGKTDEENLGFTYLELDRYIRTGTIDSLEKKERIDRLHTANQFKPVSYTHLDVYKRQGLVWLQRRGSHDCL